MASLIGKPLGKVAQEVVDLEQGRIFQSPLNKVWRALILINRATSPMAKAEPNKMGKAYDAKNLHVAPKGFVLFSSGSGPLDSESYSC